MTLFKLFVFTDKSHDRTLRLSFLFLRFTSCGILKAQISIFFTQSFSSNNVFIFSFYALWIFILLFTH